jgi:hypothetical protein
VNHGTNTYAEAGLWSTSRDHWSENPRRTQGIDEGCQQVSSKILDAAPPQDILLALEIDALALGLEQDNIT